MTLTGSVGTVIEFWEIHHYELSQGMGPDEQTQLWQRLYENLVCWVSLEGRAYAGEYPNSWLDKSALFAVALFAGLFLGIAALVVLAGKRLWIAISSLRI